MKTKLFFTVICLAWFQITAMAQTRLSVGAVGGFRLKPSDSHFSPMGGVSAWYRMYQKVYWSGEYMLYDGIDYYSIPSGYVGAGLSTEGNLTQRLSLGLHYPVITRSSTSRDLIGLHFGQSWENRDYRLVTLPLDNSGEAVVVTETASAQRSVLFASWTALGEVGSFPFFLQARYGYTFANESALSMQNKRSFLQAALGVHFKLL
jgi:hypothetical protein